MFGSLRARLLATHLLVAGLVLLLLMVSFLLILANNPAGEQFVYSRLDTIQRIGAAQIRLRANEQDRLALDRVLGLLARPIGAHVVLLDEGGDRLFERPAGAPALPAAAVAQALADAEGHSDFRSPRGRRWLLSAASMPAGRALIAVAPGPTVRTLAAMAREALGPLAQASVLALAASALVAVLISRWVAGPLMKLGTAAQEVAEGDYDQELEPAGPAEMRELTLAFNDMIRQVRSSQQAHRDFVANVSHELKTPLTSIQGFAQALVDGTASDGEGRARAGRIILQESDRLQRLVEELLALARFDAGQVVLERVALDLRELLAAVIERMRPAAAERGIELRQEIADLPRMVGDHDRLTQVFLNLLDNAIRHSRQGGRVIVTGERHRDQLALSVSDSGPGIQPEALPRLFERFYQVDSSRSGQAERGTGLGLAIAQEIVRAHGGSIAVDSTPGQGSVFSVRLPISRPEDSTIERIRR